MPLVTIADYTEAIRLDPKLGPNNERVIIKRVFAAKNAARAADVRHICSEKYQTAKAAGTLNSGTWPQFYSKCTAEIKAHPPTAAAPPLAPVPLPRAEEAPAPPVAAERTAAERAAAEAARLLQLRRDTEVLARADFNQRKLAAVEAERLAAQRQHAAAAGNATHDLTEGPRPNNGLSKITKLGEMLQQLPIGHIFLAAPKTMKVSEVRSVEARVGINVPMEILRQQILAGGAQTVEGSLRTSSEMIATLSGPGFKITATTPEQQSVAEGFPTGWEWNVEAMQDGDQELTATLCALVPDGDKTNRQRIESYTRDIAVSVKEPTWNERLKAFSEGISTIQTIVAALGGIAAAALGWFSNEPRRRQRAHKTSGHRSQFRRCFVLHYWRNCPYRGVTLQRERHLVTRTCDRRRSLACFRHSSTSSRQAFPREAEMTNIQLFAFVILPLALTALVGLLVFGVDYYDRHHLE